ncbi:MAG: hypothetical protein VW806_14085 [Halieaceae bacterium]|jgi:hypothetical protein
MRRKNDLPEVQPMGQGGMGHDLMLQGGTRRMNAPDHEQFAEYVRAHAADLPFLSQEEERQLVRAGVARFAIDYDEARWLAVGILHESNVALERQLDRRLEGVLLRFSKTSRRRKISRREFNDAVAIYRNWARNGISEQDVKIKTKRMIEENDWRVGRSRWTRSKRWYNKIPE